VQYTGSTRGQWVLDNWSTLAQRFVKVMPTDYKLALKKLEEETQAMQPGGLEVAHG
jgi:glutamate synthase domain-containing protein 3